MLETTHLPSRIHQECLGTTASAEHGTSLTLWETVYPSSLRWHPLSERMPWCTTSGLDETPLPLVISGADETSQGTFGVDTWQTPNLFYLCLKCPPHACQNL